VKRIYDAKREYLETEIPSELSARVSEAIEKRSPERRGLAFYTKTVIAPIAVCAAICIAIGLGAVPNEVPEEAADDEAISLARAMPTADTAAKSETAPSVNGTADEVMEDATGWQLLSDEYISNEAEEGRLPLKKPIELTFASGAGAWGNVIVLNADGTFEGNYGDSEAGSADAEYPRGTHYYCSYSGKFKNIKKINEYTYSMSLATVEYDMEEPMEYVEEGIRMVKSEPYGIEGGKEFVFYLPDAPMFVLSEDEKNWWHGHTYGEDEPETLSVCGLVNKKTAEGFFSHPFKE